MEAVGWKKKNILAANEEQYRDEIIRLVSELGSLKKLVRLYSYILGIHDEMK